MMLSNKVLFYIKFRHIIPFILNWVKRALLVSVTINFPKKELQKQNSIYSHFRYHWFLTPQRRGDLIPSPQTWTKSIKTQDWCVWFKIVNMSSLVIRLLSFISDKEMPVKEQLMHPGLWQGRNLEHSCCGSQIHASELGCSEPSLNHSESNWATWCFDGRLQVNI